MANRRGVKLIAPDRDGILSYQGNCKLIIDCVMSKLLKIEPKNMEFPDISVMFEWKWKFIQKKNLMFVFAGNKIQDFVLIFSSEKICKKVHNAIYRNREEDFIEEEKFQQRLLIRISQTISSQNIFSTKFKKVILKWIEKHEENEKKELLKLLKMHENNHQIMSVKNIKREPNIAIARKRRFIEMDNAEREEENSALINNGLNNVNRENYAEEVSNQKIGLSSAKLIDESMFKIVNFKSPNGIHRKLLVFTSVAKTHCYEYYFRKKKQNFNHRCFEGAKGFKAILKLNEEGKECIKFEDKKHACSPIKYYPENYFELKIIKKPNYEIIGNCTTQSKRILIIFDSNDRNQCYEYYWNNNFRCRGCALKRKYTSAEVCNEKTESEYIQLLKDEHVCEKRKYIPEKFNQTKKFVFSPNFEIQTKYKDGKERKRLIIFEKTNPKWCYSYFFQTASNVFYCCGCKQKSVIVSAKLSQNDVGEDYVILSNVEHVCSLQTYIPQQKELILRPPNFKFQKHTSKLFIFDSSEKNLYYKFTQMGSNARRYQCLGCEASKKKKNLSKGSVSVFFYKDDNNSNGGDSYVKMLDGQKHICKPQKYEAEKFEVTVLKPNEDYISFQSKDKFGLAIYCPENKSLCYTYIYDGSTKLFKCLECRKRKTYITAKLYKDSDGNEYLIPNQKKHVCNPIKYSSVIKSDTVILEKSGLFFEKPKKKEEFDESKIVRLPNFELQRNAWDVPERRLLVFSDDDKKQCYEYGYNGQFRCNKCQITAKLHSENDEKYIVLSNDEHKCEPVKYQAEKKIIESSDFVIFNREDDSKPTKLIIFTSSTKEFCYECTLLPRDQYFRCCGCWILKKTVSAKLMKDSDGTEYVQLSKNAHICTPKKFILEEFQPKIVAESGFILCTNKNGKPNSKVIILDPSKNGFGYEYYDEHKNYFTCIHCIKKNKRVTAKLCENKNGEKFLELSVEKHFCKSVKYNSENLNQKKSYENFVVHHNTAGDLNSRLTIFDQNDKNLGYQFSYRKSKNLFFCCGCKKKQKSITVKLNTDKNGKQYFEYNKSAHICSIQNFKEKGIIFNDFKFEENKTILITMKPNGKGNFYKFKYDSSFDALCCMKCKEKKKIITATVCNGNDGKEFILLNDVHCQGRQQGGAQGARAPPPEMDEFPLIFCRHVPKAAKDQRRAPLEIVFC